MKLFWQNRNVFRQTVGNTTRPNHATSPDETFQQEIRSKDWWIE